MSPVIRVMMPSAPVGRGVALERPLSPVAPPLFDTLVPIRPDLAETAGLLLRRHDITFGRVDGLALTAGFVAFVNLIAADIVCDTHLRESISIAFEGGPLERTTETLFRYIGYRDLRIYFDAQLGDEEVRLVHHDGGWGFIAEAQRRARVPFREGP